MGVGRGKKASQEIFSETSSEQKGKHQTFIKSFLEKGYKIESEDVDQKKGLDGELVSETTTTILKPNDDSFPMLKFEDIETFGRYNYETGGFDKWENPRFEVRAYKKSADIRHINASWEMIDLDD